ncbi:MAG TPA: EAL domain-containing protein [Burkholderiaceae bacterium]|jgi:EAL domain-containing protein (putative c-di-GMP-specific phosphodiesterase class I)/GGDEF domain-containing protein
MPLADPNSSLFLVQEELARTTRLYAMLSQINRAIVRAEDPQYLFGNVCRIAVEHAGFALAWVGLSEPNSNRIALVAHAGEASSILKMHFMATATGTERQSPASRAILDEKPCVVNYLLADSQLHACHREIAAHNLQAAASFPLRLEGRVMGAFTVAATSPGFFTDKELRLLTEVADDISFAMDVMRREEQRSIAESKMQYLAYYDGQTGLPSHVLFESRLFEIARHASSLAVLAINLTRFHGVLQSLGQEAGAEISRAMASKLESALSSGFVARVAESQFIVLIDNFPDVDALAGAAQLVHDAMAEAVWIDGREVYLEPYIGIAHYPQDGPVHTLLNYALLAANMKPYDSGRYRFFAAHMEHGPKRRLDLENALRRALKQKEFVLHYQPQVDLVSGRVIGAEALIRWNRPDHGMVSPLEFIPLLEENGMIWEVGEWAMNEACRINRSWQDQGLPPIRMAVNLSARQFQDGDIHDMVKKALDLSRLDPKWLELELTEGIVLLNADAVISTMKSLIEVGVSHALDDFGTGYSSLSYLQRLPVERIKIDRSFVSDITANPGDAAIARAMVGMAHSLNMTVIAEGVETEGQLGYLRDLGCEEIQGYYFSRPLAEQDFVALLKSGRSIMPAPKANVRERVLLLVGSELDALQHLGAILAHEKYRLVYAANPRDGFEAMAINNVGVVLCDQLMPEMSGTEFLKRVGDLYPHAIRIVMSETLEMGPMLEAINSGTIYKFLAKPWNEALVMTCLRDAFRLFEVSLLNRELTSRLEVHEPRQSG